MIVNDLLKYDAFKELTISDGEREIKGVYIGDLLSWVMGRAQADNIWITIMSNSNIVAVATLADVGCILLAEGVTLGEDITTLASEKGVNIFSTELNCYDAAIKVSEVI